MKNQQGFTVVETVVTLVVAVLFVITINTLFVAIIRSTASNRNRADASNAAYAYLRKYAYAGAPTNWFACTNSDDMQANSNPSGQSLERGQLDASQTTLPQPVSYAITAFAPYGCGADATGAPVLLRATVTYGPDKLSVDHATYLERS